MMGDRTGPGHPADSASVSGRTEPRAKSWEPAAHEVRVTPELEFRGRATIAVIRLSCTGCPGWRRTLDQSYRLDGLADLQPQHDGSGT
jgi:hypothetical protein